MRARYVLPDLDLLQRTEAGDTLLLNLFPDVTLTATIDLNDVHAIYEIDQSAFPPEAPPRPVDSPGQELSSIAPTADDGSQIDVMVACTPAARAAAGGTTAIQNLINLAVAETNQSYNNSQITRNCTWPTWWRYPIPSQGTWCWTWSA